MNDDNPYRSPLSHGERESTTYYVYYAIILLFMILMYCGMFGFWASLAMSLFTLEMKWFYFCGGSFGAMVLASLFGQIFMLALETKQRL